MFHDITVNLSREAQGEHAATMSAHISWNPL